MTLTFIFTWAVLYAHAFAPSQHAHRRLSRHTFFSSRQQDPNAVFRSLLLAKHTVLCIAAAASLLPFEVLTTPPMIEPPPRDADEQARRIYSSRILKQGWDSDVMAAGYRVPEAPATDDPDKAWTYGEITTLGARQLFVYMGLLDNSNNVSFLDMGSGLGKLVVQAYMEVPRLTQAVGIELSQTRHDLACKSWEAVQDQAVRVRTETKAYHESAAIHLVKGDFLDWNLSDVTHVYVSSLCFHDDLVYRLGEKLAREGESLQCIATLKRFPASLENGPLGHPTSEFVEMTWTSPMGGEVYFYRPDTAKKECRLDVR